MHRLPLCLTLLSCLALAEEPAPPASPLDAVVAELRRLKEELVVPAPVYESYNGLGPAASKVYFAPKGLSIGGYGEVSARADLDRLERSTTDLHRVVLYAGYRFSDRVVFNSELEFEHGSTEQGGAVSVEFAYLDFQLTSALSVRAGNVLVPMGFTNEIHEPVFYFGVSRPVVETALIPSTWNENGLGVAGDWKGLRYRAYLLSGLRAVGGEGFGDGTWIRGGRQGGAEALAADLAGVAALDWLSGPLRVGASSYYGHSGQGAQVDGARVQGAVFLGEAHAAWQHKGLWLRGLLAWGRLGDAAAISRANGQTVGQEVLGGYAEAAYDVLPLLTEGTEQSLSPFVRWESLDTQKAVAAGFARDAAQSRAVLTAGLHYRPVPNVALKLDYQQVTPGAGPASHGVNAGIGFVF